MAGTKKMNELGFAKLMKDFNSTGELIRARQEEKQALLEEYIKENKRFFFGDISEKALASSARKTNRELARLDREIKSAISKAKSLSGKATSTVKAQSPQTLRATLTGIAGFKRPAGKKKKKVAKKPAKKKASPKKKVMKKKASSKKTKKRR